MANEGWLERVLGKDPDEAFAYLTKKYVIINDKTIALLALFLKGTVLFYILFYVRGTHRLCIHCDSTKPRCRI